MPGYKGNIYKLTDEEIRRRNIALQIKPFSVLGAIGEYTAINKLMEYNIPVYQHFGFDRYVDLIAEFDGKMQRIQVKTSTQLQTNGTIVFSLNAASYTTQNGIQKNKYIPFTKKEIDYFILYDFIRNKLYLVPVPEPGKTVINLCEYTSPGTNPEYMRADYDIDKMLQKFQPICASYKVIESGDINANL